MQQLESAFSVGELVKYIFFLAISAGVAWIAKSLPAFRKEMSDLRDDVRQMKQVLMGVNGDNGLRSDVARNHARITDIEKRHIREDAITEIEKELSEGQRRRLRDKMMGDESDE